jgi:hypothetical protein
MFIGDRLEIRRRFPGKKKEGVQAFLFLLFRGINVWSIGISGEPLSGRIFYAL